MDNPIIENRIVNDKTFAVRLKSFLESMKRNAYCDPALYEEYNYLVKIAKKLIAYQILTATTEEEIVYFKNLDIEIK